MVERVCTILLIKEQKKPDIATSYVQGIQLCEVLACNFLQETDSQIAKN